MAREALAYVCLGLLVVMVASCAARVGSLIVSPSSSPGESPQTPPSVQPTLRDTPTHDSHQTKETAVPSVTFSPSSAQHTPPEDVLQEVWFFFGGAAEDELDCQDGYQRPTVAFPPSTLWEESLRLFLDSLSVGTCGWQADESVRITLRFPDGKSIQRDRNAAKRGDGYGVPFDYTPDWYDPVGIYTVLFEGESGAVHYSQRVVRPAGPVLVWDWDVSGEWKASGTLFLFGFKPSESVRLLVYEEPDEGEPKGILAAWQEFQVDSNGQLVIRSDFDDSLNVIGYAAVGEMSGEATTYWRYLDREGRQLLHTCRHFWEAVFPCYVVADTGIDQVSLREGAGLTYPVVAQVPAGTKMEVVRQRHLDDEGAAWWHVRLGDDIEGYVIDDEVTIVRE